jgi:hypothetical protein
VSARSPESADRQIKQSIQGYFGTSNASVIVNKTAVAEGYEVGSCPLFTLLRATLLPPGNRIAHQ